MKRKRTIYNLYIKRFLDIFNSFIIMIVLLPFFVLISLLIIVIDHTNPFFLQIRTGINGKEFKIIKFKTMKNDVSTKLGRILRTTSIDELPQIINIFIGNMSFVGPRPWIVDYYKNFNKNQKRRLLEKPGIIGLAQVNGRNNIDIFTKIDYDIYYVDNISFMLDLKIFFKSFKVIFVKEEKNDTSCKYIENEIEELRKYNKKKIKK